MDVSVYPLDMPQVRPVGRRNWWHGKWPTPLLVPFSISLDVK